MILCPNTGKNIGRSQLCPALKCLSVITRKIFADPHKLNVEQLHAGVLKGFFDILKQLRVFFQTSLRFSGQPHRNSTKTYIVITSLCGNPDLIKRIHSRNCEIGQGKLSFH